MIALFGEWMKQYTMCMIDYSALTVEETIAEGLCCHVQFKVVAVILCIHMCVLVLAIVSKSIKLF